MSTKGTLTNISKLVGWSVDEYDELTEDECLVCLTEKELYLLGQAMQQMRWTTRWDNPNELPLPDLDTIASTLDEKMSPDTCLDFCQLMIDCINDPDSGVGQSIISTVGNTTSTELIEVGQGQRDLLLGDGNNPLCDSDIWWGGINNMVDQLDTNNMDALQILEVLTNVGEWVTQVAGGIFGVEAPLIQSMLEWGTFIQESILENYEAQITTAYMDQVKCDLFCVAINNCELSPQDIVDYFYERLEASLSYGSLLNESLEFLVLGVWSGSEIADAMMLSQVVFRAQFGMWFQDVAFNSIDLDLRLGFNDPSNDWVLLCDECQWIHKWLDGNGNPEVDGWYIEDGAYEPVEDEIDWSITGSSASSQTTYTFTQDAVITKLQFRFRTFMTSSNRNEFITIRDDEDNVLQIESLNVDDDPEHQTHTMTWTGTQAVEAGYWLEVHARATYNPPDVYVFIEHLEVRGTGTDPFA